MAETGLGDAVSDAGVGAACARTAVLGAGLNVRINARDLTDEGVRDGYLSQAADLLDRAAREEAEILAIVDAKIDG